MKYIRKIWIPILFFLAIAIYPISISQAANENVTIESSSRNAGANAQYKITVELGDTPFNQGSTVSVRFPAGFSFEQKKQILTISAASTTDVIGIVDDSDPTQPKIEFALPWNVSTTENIIIDKIQVTNPYPSGTYPVVVSVDNVDLPAGNISITATSITISNVISGNSDNTIPNEFTITFTGTKLNAGDYIYLHLDNALSLNPSALSRNYFLINNTAAAAVEYVTNPTKSPLATARIGIQVPNNLNGNTVTLKILSDAKIGQNQYGNFTFSMYTSKDLNPVNNTLVIGQQVQDVTVRVSPNQYAQAALYDISFKTSANGSLAGTTNPTIELVFPVGTNLNSVNTSNTIFVNGEKATASVDRTNRKLTITVPANVVSQIGTSSKVNLLILSDANIKNPSAGTHRLQIRTSVDKVYNNSGTFNTTGNPTTSNPGQGTSNTLKLSSSDANAASRYEITYRTSSTGALKGGEDDIYITFPSSAQIPNFIDREYIRVNSATVDTGLVRINNNTLSFRLPSKVNIGSNQSFMITIDEKAQILHPDQEATYVLYVSTSKDSNTSYVYKVVGRTSYDFYVEPIYDENQLITYYQMSFKPARSGTLRADYDWVELTLSKTLKKQQISEQLQISFNGNPVDMSKVQVSGSILSFFIPVDTPTIYGDRISIDLYDSDLLLAENRDGTITFKIRTSRDTNWKESNQIRTYRKATQATQPLNPQSPNVPAPSSGQGSQSVSTKIKLYLNRKDTYVNGIRDRDLLAAPYVHPKKDGVTMVPIRFISESIGAYVDYEPRTKMISITYDGKIIVLYLNSDKAMVQGKVQQLAAPVEAKVDGITFIPIRSITEWLGFVVDYDETEKSIMLQK